MRNTVLPNWKLLGLPILLLQVGCITARPQLPTLDTCYPQDSGTQARCVPAQGDPYPLPYNDVICHPLTQWDGYVEAAHQ